MGYRKGLIRTLFSLLSFIVGLLLTLKLSPYAIEFLQSTFNLDGVLALIIGILLCFFLITGVIKWVGKSLEKMLKKAKLNVFNKIQGGVILTVLMIFVYSIIIWFLDQTQLISDTQRLESRTYDFLTTVPGKMQAFLNEFKPLFEKFWQLVSDVIKSRNG